MLKGISTRWICAINFERVIYFVTLIFFMDSSGDPQAKKYIAESKCSVSMMICKVLCFFCWCLGYTMSVFSHHMMSLCCYVECSCFYPVDNQVLGSARIIQLVPTENFLSHGHSPKRWILMYLYSSIVVFLRAGGRYSSCNTLWLISLTIWFNLSI